MKTFIVTMAAGFAIGYYVEPMRIVDPRLPAIITTIYLFGGMYLLTGRTARLLHIVFNRGKNG